MNGLSRRHDPSCPPTGCEPARALVPNAPAVSLDAASIQQLIQAFAGGPAIMSQGVPRLSPSYNAKPWVRYAIAVVAPNTATGDAGAVLGATALALAEGAARFATVSVLTPASVTDFVSLFSEQMPDLTGLRVARFGARVHSSQRAIRFSVLKNGTPLNEQNSSNSGLFELSDYGDLEDPLPFYGNYDPLQTVSVVAKNLDVNSGYLVEVLLEGWQYPTELTGPGSSQRTQVNRQKSAGGLIR